MGWYHMQKVLGYIYRDKLVSNEFDMMLECDLCGQKVDIDGIGVLKL